MDNKKYKEAIKKRDKFLKKNPHMKEYQKEVEDILNKCRLKDRMEVLGIMIGTKLNDLGEQLNKIKGVHLKKSVL